MGVGVEIIRIKALLSSTGLELELSLAISSNGKFRDLKCPQNSMNHDKGSPEICVLNIGVV